MNSRKIITSISLFFIMMLFPVFKRTIYDSDPFYLVVLSFIITIFIFIYSFFDKGNHRHYQLPIASCFILILFSSTFLSESFIKNIILYTSSIFLVIFYCLRFLSKPDKDAFDFLKVLVILFFTFENSILTPIIPSLNGGYLGFVFIVDRSIIKKEIMSKFSKWTFAVLTFLCVFLTAFSYIKSTEADKVRMHSEELYQETNQKIIEEAELAERMAVQAIEAQTKAKKLQEELEKCQSRQ